MTSGESQLFQVTRIYRCMVQGWSSAMQTPGQIQCKRLVSTDAIRWSGRVQFPNMQAINHLSAGTQAHATSDSKPPTQRADIDKTLGAHKRRAGCLAARGRPSVNQRTTGFGFPPHIQHPVEAASNLTRSTRFLSTLALSTCS